ncbi:DUF6313 family protein [Actinosynnema sp. NPDC020468]|uniref:DUF6313 family protein n=1 Tax=Actinosynnema sp. NPDC020468 TaxID=3154488 RepID=UPI0033C0B3B1
MTGVGTPSGSGPGANPGARPVWGESTRRRARRWWRGRNRLDGIPYWLVTQGWKLIAGMVLLFVVNGLLTGFATAYDVVSQISSPFAVDRADRWWKELPALLLSVSGWLIVTGFAGAVAGYVVVEATTNRRARREGKAGRLATRGIPLLESLQYHRHGHEVPPYFAFKFADWHGMNWPAAQNHWEQMVEEYLETNAFDRRQGPDGVIRTAVTTAAYLLDGLPDVCPRCVPDG